MAVIHRIKTIDAHAAGEPLRLVIDGLPSPDGRTMLEKREWAHKRLDHLRKGLILEPRGLYGIWIRFRNYWKGWPFSY